MMRMIIMLLLLAITMAACDDDENQRDIDERRILEYIDENNLDAQSTGTGLYYVIENPGNNEHPDLSSNISITYTGRLLNGQQFDSSNGMVVTFPLQNLILGWQEGIPLFGKGGNGILIIPSHQGYGSSGRPGIPPNSVLVFDIELVDFN